MMAGTGCSISGTEECIALQYQILRKTAGEKLVMLTSTRSLWTNSTVLRLALRAWAAGTQDMHRSARLVHLEQLVERRKAMKRRAVWLLANPPLRIS